MTDKFDPEYIQKVIEFLEHRETGGITEVRIFPKDRYLIINGRREYVGKTVSGYYDDYVKLAKDIQPFDGKASIYVTINPVKPALLARYNNRLEYNATHTTSDDDILIDLWFPYDADPIRPADISSTDTELEATLAKRDEVAQFLAQWTASIKGMSGNGGHGLIRLVGYPNNQETRQAKEKLTHFLSEKFTDGCVSLDNTVFNMARIWKLYGVMSTKGDNVPDRPHRRAYLEIPEVVPEPIDLYSHIDEIIPPDWTPKNVKATIQPKQKIITKNWGRRRVNASHAGDYPKLDVPAYLNAWGGEWRQKEKAETTWFEFRKCPLHTDDDGHEWECGLRQDSDGKMGAKCQHEQSYGWQDFKAVLGDPKPFYKKIQRPKKQVKIIPKDVIPDEVLDEMAEKEKPQKQPTAWVTEPIDEAELDTTPSISIPVLPETVWRGTFADYRALMSPTTEASDAYHFACFFAIVGALLGRSVFMYYGGRMYPNFFTVIEGRTGISRKSTALSQATDTLKAVDSTVLIRRGLSTTEGLINLLKAPTAEELEEYTEQLAAYKEGRISIEPVQPPPVFPHEGRRLLVAMDEFALLLKKTKQDFSSSLIQTLTDAYDMKGSLDNPTKERPMSALNTCVSMVGLTTKAWLERTLDYDDLLGGFVNRFVFFVGEPKASIPLPPEPDAQLWNRIKIYLNNVRQGNHTFALKEKSSIQYRLSEEAKAVWEDFYNSWRERQLTSDNEMEVCLFQRLPNHAMKLALTRAVLEDKGGTRQINTEQLNAGIDFANYAERSYEYLFHSFGFSRRSRVEAMIEEKLRGNPLTKRELRRVISSSVSTKELNEALTDLIRIDKIGERFINTTTDTGQKRKKTFLVLLK